MKTIEVGAVKIHLEENEDMAGVMRELLRPVSNKEVAAMLGICDRTVVRWKKAGRLPRRGSDQVHMVDLLRHIAPNKTCDSCGGKL